MSATAGQCIYCGAHLESGMVSAEWRPAGGRPALETLVFACGTAVRYERGHYVSHTRTDKCREDEIALYARMGLVAPGSEPRE